MVGERETHVATVVLGISVVLIVVGAIPVIVVSQVMKMITCQAYQLFVSPEIQSSNCRGCDILNYGKTESTLGNIH